MSTLKGLLGIGAGGGGDAVPINGIAQFANAPTLYTDLDNNVWLKAGNIVTDTATYPNAIKINGGMSVTALESTTGIIWNEGSVYINMTMNPSGTILYVLSNSSPIAQFNLSTPYDITTAVYSKKNNNINNVNSIIFNSSGTILITGVSSTIRVYTLTTAWDINTAALSSTSINLSAYAANTVGARFNNDGTKLFFGNNNNNTLHEFTVTTPYDVSSIVFVRSKTLNQNSNISDLKFSDDGTKVYGLDYVNQTIYQYTLGSAWNITTVTYTTGRSTSAGGTEPSFFMISNNGTRLHYHDYTTLWTTVLTTAWNISSGSGLTQVNKPFYTILSDVGGLSFNLDGTKMYAISKSTRFFEFNLTTPYDYRTATLGNTIILGQSEHLALFIRRDGLRMYTVNGNAIRQYNFGTAWNISTLTYITQATLSGSTTTNGLAWKSDGTRFWTSHNGTHVYEFNVTTPWDITTTVYNAVVTKGATALFFIDSMNTLVRAGTGAITSNELSSPPSITTIGSDLGTSGNIFPGDNEIFIADTLDKIYAVGDATDLYSIYTYNPFYVGLQSATGMDPNSYVRIK